MNGTNKPSPYIEHQFQCSLTGRDPEDAFRTKAVRKQAIHKHGDECPDCGGCIRWNESENFNGCVFQCDECSECSTESHERG